MSDEIAADNQIVNKEYDVDGTYHSFLLYIFEKIFRIKTCVLLISYVYYKA